MSKRQKISLIVIVVLSIIFIVAFFVIKDRAPKNQQPSVDKQVEAQQIAPAQEDVIESVTVPAQVESADNTKSIVDQKVVDSISIPQAKDSSLVVDRDVLDSLSVPVKK